MKEEDELYYRQRTAQVDRLARFMRESRIRGKKVAEEIGVSPATISRFLDPGEQKIGRRFLGRLKTYLDDKGCPEAIPRVELKRGDYDLLWVIKVVVETEGLSSCTLPQLLFLASIGDAEHSCPDLDLKVPKEDRDFNLLSALKIVVATNRQQCTVVDLLKFAKSQRSEG
jgi:hypothetical protein